MYISKACRYYYLIIFKSRSEAPTKEGDVIAFQCPAGHVNLQRQVLCTETV